MINYDVLVVGAGFSGLVLAERLCNEMGKRCLVVDRRFHIGGNVFDYHDNSGVLIHKYGPHIFHTNSEKIFEYLSRFTKWIPSQFRAKSFTHGQYWSFPINLETFEQFVGHPSTTEEMEEYLDSQRIPIDHPRNSEEVILSKVGWEFYERFYKGYTLKQWGRHPKELDASVLSRIPIRTTRGDRYFDDKHQVMPMPSYSCMFWDMIHKSPLVDTLVGVDYREIARYVNPQHTIYTGPVDEYFNYRFGPLPYRTLRFEHDTYGAHQLTDGFKQPCCVVTYPNSETFTRSVEIKHVTRQNCENSTVVREYPEEFTKGKEPYYPVPSPVAAKAYQQYKELADREKNVSFVGRLAQYRYYNMDQAVGAALAEFERLRRLPWTNKR